MWNDILASIIALLTIVSLFIHVRSFWVMEKRSELNRFVDSKHLIFEYADYDTMMWKFWIWNVEQFKLEKP